MNKIMYTPDGGHDLTFKRKPLLAFDENGDFLSQKKAITEKLKECLGLMPEKVDLNPVIEEETECDKWKEYRIRFDVEKGVQAICILCIPKDGKEKHPLAICLQGHSTGMHNSLARKKYPNDAAEGDRDIALQVLERGFAALCLEQRGMGERRTDREGNGSPDLGHTRCHVTVTGALLLGRTMIGERCWDVSRAIDLALTFPEIDGDRIMCTGNSGGGTATYYAACFDERIKVAMPCCAVCTYSDSIAAMYHCSCNIVPNIALYADMGDLAAAIAPRKLIVVCGEQDPIFPIYGVKKTYETIEAVYRAAGADKNCALAIGAEGHRYYKKEAWKAFQDVVGTDENWS